jgi:hypothetical protein
VQHILIKVIFQSKYVARIVEGCNATSVIIFLFHLWSLFWKNYNLTFLSWRKPSYLCFECNENSSFGKYFYFPKQEPFLHGVPLYIYGVVFILWLIWVRKFSRYAQKILNNKLSSYNFLFWWHYYAGSSFENELFYDPF